MLTCPLQRIPQELQLNKISHTLDEIVVFAKVDAGRFMMSLTFFTKQSDLLFLFYCIH